MNTLGTMHDDAHATGSAEDLRRTLVDTLVADRSIRSDAVEAAFRAVPRHVFAPEATAQEAYVNDSVTTKRNEQGAPISSVSAPWLQARMLEQSGLGTGMRALEIGSGGYNAALMAEVVGEHGEVVSVDIDSEITERARALLSDAGYERVRVLCADGAYGAGEEAPPEGFDAIIVTAQASDLPPAWREQLAPAGRMVVPLSFRGLYRVVCFEREESGHLRSRELTTCGFVGMQGANAFAGDAVLLDDRGLRLMLDADQHADAEALRGAVGSASPATVWTGVVLRGDEGVLPSLDMWLVGAVEPAGRVHASSQAVEHGLSGWTMASAATWNASSIAHLTIRPAQTPGSPGGFEFGARAYGPDREQLAQRLVEQVRAWNTHHRSPAAPVLHAYPAGTPDDQLTAGHIVDKPQTRLIVSVP